MPSLLCCGPKLAACGIVLSIWGIVMLVLLGVFFNVHSAILLDDVPYDPADIEKDQIGPVHAAFEQVSYNCFIAAALYVGLGLWALCQARLNKRRQYLHD